jgi:hypothetical protein
MRGADRTRIEPAYVSRHGHSIILFAGNLEVHRDGLKQVVPGQIELRLSQPPNLVAHFAGPAKHLHVLTFFGAAPAQHEISIPLEARLDPPEDSILPSQKGESNWYEEEMRLSNVTAGSLLGVKYLLFHVVGGSRSTSGRCS